MQKQDDREERIIMEIVVDAYDEQERAMGWYYYLDDLIQFPFAAKCNTHRPTSLLKVADSVQVLGMADEDTCLNEMFVNISWDDGTLSVPLSQLDPVDANDKTIQAIGDWHYWMAMGYEF